MDRPVTFRERLKKAMPRPLVKFFRKAHAVGAECADLGRFILNFKGRLKARADYKKGSAPEDYLKLANSEFRIWQKEKEVLGFIRHAAARKPGFVCEIGACSCGLTFLLANALETVSSLIGIDWMVRNRLMMRYLSRPGQKVSLIDGFSCEPNTLNKVKRIASGRRFDLLFIDGDHSYKGVKEDFLNYRHLVAENGMIAFHDIVPDSLTRKGIQTSSRTGGVPLFFERISGLYPSVKFIADPEQDGFGIGVITYSSGVAIPDGLL
jgi:predicted O-methyltransferase YrrM